jgi:hypothetical protein
MSEEIEETKPRFIVRLCSILGSIADRALWFLLGALTIILMIIANSILKLV